MVVWNFFHQQYLSCNDVEPSNWNVAIYFNGWPSGSMKNGCFTKHPSKTGCWGHQVFHPLCHSFYHVCCFHLFSGISNANLEPQTTIFNGCLGKLPFSMVTIWKPSSHWNNQNQNGCLGNQVSNEKRAPGCLVFFVGDEILPSYM